MLRILAATILMTLAAPSARAGNLADLTKGLRKSDPNALRRAAELGEKAAAVAKTVVKLLDKDPLRDLAKNALIAMGPNAFADTARGFSSKKWRARLATVEVLKSYAVSRPAVVDTHMRVLLKAHRSSVGTIRHGIEFMFPLATAGSLPLLRSEMEQKSPLRRAPAAVAIGRNRFAEPADTKRLITLCSDGDVRVRFSAYDSLWRKPYPADAARAQLWKGLQDPDSGVRRICRFGIPGVGAPAVPSVLATLGRYEFGWRSVAALLRHEIDALREAGAAKDPVRASAAIRVLGQNGGLLPAQAYALVKKNLAADHPGIRAAAAEAFGRCATRLDGSPLDALIPLLEDMKDAVRVGAARGMAATFRRSDIIRDAVAAKLEGASPELESALAEALLRHGGDTDSPIAAMRRAVASKPTEETVRAIGDLGPRAGAAVPELAKALGGSPEVTSRAARAIGDLLAKRRMLIHTRRKRWRSWPKRRRAVRRGLDWLAAHQDTAARKINMPDGRWSAATFGKHDGKASLDDQGLTRYDVGTTSLALMAFLAAGYTDVGEQMSNPYADHVREGLDFLVKFQSTPGAVLKLKNPVVQQSMVLTALAEARMMTAQPQRYGAEMVAREFLLAARNPNLAWRYGVRTGENDTHCTAWATTALSLAKLSGHMFVNEEAFVGARVWFDMMTDPEFGQMGYLQAGGSPSELVKNRDPETGLLEGDTWIQSCVAFGSWAWEWLGGSPYRAKAIDLMLEVPPHPEHVCLCYWFYGNSFLALQDERPVVAGSKEKAWVEASHTILVDTQETSGFKKGSWAPNGKWGSVGGRVYSTAMSLLTLLAGGRYDRNVLTARPLTEVEQKVVKKLKSLRKHKDLGVREAAQIAVLRIESPD